MLSKKKVLGLVEAGRKISRAPLVRVDALHERAMRLPDFRRPGARPKAQDLIGFLFRQRARARRAARPRCRIALQVFTPAGLPAVQIGFE
jgi:hypothetical protein